MCIWKFVAGGLDEIQWIRGRIGFFKCSKMMEFFSLCAAWFCIDFKRGNCVYFGFKFRNKVWL